MAAAAPPPAQLALPGLGASAQRARPPELPPGFVLREALVTPEEERELLDALRRVELGSYVLHGTAARRRVAYFGVGYERRPAGEPHRGGIEAVLPEVPPFLLALRPRVAQMAGAEPGELEQVLVTHYPAGAGIGWHRDLPQFGIVAGLSLAAPCVFRLRRMGASARGAVNLDLQPRSAYVLAGAARWSWQHAIPPVKAERWSLTFRTLREVRDGR